MFKDQPLPATHGPRHKDKSSPGPRADPGALSEAGPAVHPHLTFPDALHLRPLPHSLLAPVRLCPALPPPGLHCLEKMPALSFQGGCFGTLWARRPSLSEKDDFQQQITSMSNCTLATVPGGQKRLDSGKCRQQSEGQGGEGSFP